MSNTTSNNYENTSPSMAYQRSSVCVPVSVKPFATAGTPVTKCCGSPFITLGKNTCEGVKNGECVFTITQDICVEMPVHFGATATVGDTYVNCISASENNTCLDCRSEGINEYK